MNILLVDDNDELREFLALSLSEAGLQATTVATTAEAVRKVETNRYDVLLIDSVLGNENGLDLVEQVRELKNGKTTPILLMSSISTALARRMATAVGCDEFLVKPFGLTQLVELARTMGRGKR